ncbi:MAG: hypothetical protein U9R52_00255 [Candidatus Omnitrophota bacterium]|nr:hypothetical protein [Candidatus Omnitrophota bacterium]
MRKFCIMLTALVLVGAFISTGYADRAVQAAEATFKQVRKVYILAKKELGDAQIDALLTVGKAEKREAVKKVRKARKELRAAKKLYKSAISKLRKAEMARDAKIDRSPWR